MKHEMIIIYTYFLSGVSPSKYVNILLLLFLISYRRPTFRVIWLTHIITIRKFEKSSKETIVQCRHNFVTKYLMNE